MNLKTLGDLASREVTVLFYCKLDRHGLLMDYYAQKACFGKLLVVGRDLNKERIQ
jgi:hypothetical protein